MSSGEAEPSGQAGRYQRSSSGLIGAMLILVLIIVGFVVFRSLFRGNQDTAVPTVDFSLAVKQARQDGVLAPAPAPMPDGWRATSVRYQAGKRPTWHLGLLTDAQTYVGIEEARSPAGTMAARYLGGSVTQGRARQLAGRTWQTWSDGKEYALTWSQGSDTVLVGGRAGKARVVRLVDVLGFGPPGGQASASPS